MESMDLVEQVYQASRTFPRREDFGLTSQMRRAAVSVSANIAEGCGRYHTREFIQYLYTSRGSLFELMTLLDLSARLRSEEHTSELQSQSNLVCRLLLEKK